MKAIILTIVLFATVACADDKFDKQVAEIEKQMKEMDAIIELIEEQPIKWQILERGEPGQYLIQVNENTFKWINQPPVEEVTITDLGVDRICFDINREDKKRCVSVKWLYEFLRMMNP
jgi:hypothetical protein